MCICVYIYIYEMCKCICINRNKTKCMSSIIPARWCVGLQHLQQMSSTGDKTFAK